MVRLRQSKRFTKGELLLIKHLSKEQKNGEKVEKGRGA